MKDTVTLSYQGDTIFCVSFLFSGGTAELERIETVIKLFEEEGHAPSHSAALSFDVCESRIDYMGNTTFLGRMSKLKTDVADRFRSFLFDKVSGRRYLEIWTRAFSTMTIYHRGCRCRQHQLDPSVVSVLSFAHGIGS